MFKVSTATGYLYGYDQDIETDMWRDIVLDWETGETTLTVPISVSPDYNNRAVGLIIDSRGNAIFCPTNTLVLTRWTDDFVYMSYASKPEVREKILFVNSHTKLRDDMYMDHAEFRPNVKKSITQLIIKYVIILDMLKIMPIFAVIFY